MPRCSQKYVLVTATAVQQVSSFTFYCCGYILGGSTLMCGTIGVAAILRSYCASYRHCTLVDTRGVWQDVPSLVRDAANIAIY